MTSSISSLAIFDEHNSLILDHVYSGTPPPPATMLRLYHQQPSPRSGVLHLASAIPAALLHSTIRDNLLFFATCASDIDPLLVLEYLHRVADALSEFLGSPLLSSKIIGNYDVVAQIIVEVADAGIVCQSEANALRDVVETGRGVLKNLLGGVGLSGSSPKLQPGGPVSALDRVAFQPAQTAQGSAIPWRRSNVRHTSNELYVDIVETLSVTLAPSGRPLSAYAFGSIAFTSKVSGVPDLLLSLSTGGKGAGMGNRGDQLRAVMERAVFHPCVRLGRWKNDGILSFVPPDGQFALCGYETDLLGHEVSFSPSKSTANNLNLPVLIEMSTGLGKQGSEFEVRIVVSPSRKSAAAASLRSNLNPSRLPPGLRSATITDSKLPALENVTVSIPLPSSVRGVSDCVSNKGEAQWLVTESRVQWKLPGDLGNSDPCLRCTIQRPAPSAGDEPPEAANGMTATTYDYDDDKAIQQTSDTNGAASPTTQGQSSGHFMPVSATLSFSMKGSLPSGLRVESLLIDAKKSRGLGDGVKPFKGVKYLTVSRDGIEARC